MINPNYAKAFAMILSVAHWNSTNDCQNCKGEDGIAKGVNKDRTLCECMKNSPFSIKLIERTFYGY